MKYKQTDAYQQQIKRMTVDGRTTKEAEKEIAFWFPFLLEKFL